MSDTVMKPPAAVAAEVWCTAAEAGKAGTVQQYVNCCFNACSCSLCRGSSDLGAKLCQSEIAPTHVTLPILV